LSSAINQLIFHKWKPTNQQAKFLEKKSEEKGLFLRCVSAELDIDTAIRRKIKISEKSIIKK
tara:strand:+ start:2142 stop:2327 length:186 start_codon:yes stop_codon:yes gene_type:complete